MVQIIQEREKPRKVSFMDRLGKAAGIAATEVPKFLMEQENQKAQAMKTQKENQVLSQLTGLSFDQLQDPTIRQKAFDFAMQGHQKEQQFGRESEFKEREASQRAMEAQQLQEQKYKEERRLERQKQGGKGPSASEMKMKKEEEEKKQVRDTAQSSFNTMSSILRKGNIGRGSGVKSFFGGKAAKDTGQFLSASAGLEAMLVDMVSRGALSNSRFKYITETVLPKPTDTDAEIEGKLTSLAELLNLDPSELTGKSTPKEGGKRPMKEFFQ